MRLDSLRDMIASVKHVGRGVLEFGAGRRPATLAQMCHELLRLKGEASVTVVAHRILSQYRALDDTGKLGFFATLAEEFACDRKQLLSAIAVYQGEPTPANAVRLSEAAEAPRQELIRLLNTAHHGTFAIVSMRADLLRLRPQIPAFEVLDHDFSHLLQAWFNRGFLTLRRIDWHTPAFILEKLIEYEAVHEIRGWPDLQRRLAEDRRCYGFFHPSLPDEPLIFVEVALVKGIAASIQGVLDAPPPTPDREFEADTAIFYSISNCQSGLAGISFGNFLIKQVTDSLGHDVPGVKRFSTLSPIPGFMRWLKETLANEQSEVLQNGDRDLLAALARPNWAGDELLCARLKPVLERLCAHYLLIARRGQEPRDPVARFHLRNGARLERINWLGDRSSKGIAESAGLLVNYLYDGRFVTENHEAYVNDGVIASSSKVEALLGKRRLRGKGNVA
jgi:malonyl-CoA decarboxylase